MKMVTFESKDGVESLCDWPDNLRVRSLRGSVVVGSRGEHLEDGIVVDMTVRQAKDRIEEVYHDNVMTETDALIDTEVPVCDSCTTYQAETGPSNGDFCAYWRHFNTKNNTCRRHQNHLASARQG